MSSETRNVCIRFEDGIEKFLDLLWEEEQIKKERTCSVVEEPPITRSVRLDIVKACCFRDIGMLKLFRKRMVCRRINFDHPEDTERLIKEANLRQLMLLRRSRLLMLKENKDKVEVVSKKRKRDEDDEAEIPRKRTRYF